MVKTIERLQDIFTDIRDEWLDENGAVFHREMVVHDDREYWINTGYTNRDMDLATTHAAEEFKKSCDLVLAKTGSV